MSRTDHIFFEGKFSSHNREPLDDAESVPMPEESPVLTEQEKLFFKKLSVASGLDFDRYRESSLKRRIASCLRAFHASDLDSVAKQLVSTDAISKATDCFLIGTTAFFRDEKVFETLTSIISKRSSGLSVLSIGCSDGSELYTIALILDQLGILENSRLEGIDFRQNAVEQARRGEYSVQSIATIPQRFQRYFLIDGRRCQVLPKISSHIEFRKANIEWDLAFKEQQYDLILCRNFCIYLKHSFSRNIWSAIAEKLSSQGILMVGKVERPTGFIKIKPHLFIKRG